MAMAWRAGCKLANLEFVQFHPTLLHRPHGPSPLISEALRGEGAHLLLPPEAAGHAAVEGATPLSGNEYKVTMARAAVKRALLRAVGQWGESDL